MFQYLQEMNAKLSERYITVEKNIKSGSASFYDSLGDLIESFFKEISLKEEIEINKISSSIKLMNNELSDFLTKEVQINDHDYERLIEVLKEINEHKHRNENKITADLIIDYLRTFFNVYNPIVKYYNGNSKNTFSGSYYVSLFEKDKKEISDLQKKIANLKESLLNEKNLTDKQQRFINKIEIIESIEYSNETFKQKLLNELLQLKDIKIDQLNKKLDNALDLLSEQKNIIRETRIISLASMGSIFGFEGESFDAYIQSAVDIIDDKGFDNHIKMQREQLKKLRLIKKEIVDQLKHKVYEIEMGDEVMMKNLKSVNPYKFYQKIANEISQIFEIQHFNVKANPAYGIALNKMAFKDEEGIYHLLLTNEKLYLFNVPIKIKVLKILIK